MKSGTLESIASLDGNGPASAAISSSVRRVGEARTPRRASIGPCGDGLLDQRLAYYVDQRGLNPHNQDAPNCES